MGLVVGTERVGCTRCLLSDDLTNIQTLDTTSLAKTPLS